MLRRLSLLTACALLLPVLALAQTADVLNEYNLQPDVWRPAKPLEPGVDARGDLNLSVPVMTIPGRNGLDYKVRFGYRSGITGVDPLRWTVTGFWF